MQFTPSSGTVYFIGAGPGAPDLITVRGRDIIAQADLVLYADSLVQDSVARLARKPGAQVVGSSGLHLEQLLTLMAETAQTDGVVARVHTGDPALYGAIHEQMAGLDARGVPYAVVPGVTAAFAAAARLGIELTLPEIVQTIILTRAAGRTPMPPGEDLRSLAAHGASLAIYLSIAHLPQVVADLLAGGAYQPQTPVAVLHKVTWPDESLLIGTLANIVDQVATAGYTRHALILVSPTLERSVHTRSQLYSQTFSHGFRHASTTKVPAPLPTTVSDQLAPATQLARMVIISVTKAGSQLALRLGTALAATISVPERFAVTEHPGAPMPYTGPVADEIRRHWQPHSQLILVMSTGIAVRAIAPLLGHKSSDPAVVCLDEAGRTVIPLLGGHQAGANALAQRIATLTGGHAAITTASEVQSRPALDLLGRAAGWRIDPASALTHASACLVNDEPVGVFIDPDLTLAPAVLAELSSTPNLLPVTSIAELTSGDYAAGLLITPHIPADWPTLQHTCVLYHPPVLVVGIGCRRDVPAAELRVALETTLADAGLALASVGALATAELKADEPGLQQLAHDLGVPLQIVTRDQLAALDPTSFTPSAAQTHVDLPGVAEPCATLVAGGPLLVPKRAFERCTVAVALRTTADSHLQPADHHLPTRRGMLALVSLGPGDVQQMTLGAHAALSTAEVVIGYSTYIELIRTLLRPDQEIMSGEMRSELERARQAIDLAVAGRRVALISSGDIGIYAMAAPVFETLHQRGWTGDDPPVAVFPGVSAFQAAAARLGAAINHDFCVISLSDLLTPWAVIEQRLQAVARGDFVLALYNPRSRGRDWQLERALDILRTCRPATTPVALGRNLARPDETIILTTLAEIDPTQADMLTVVLVGNSQSYALGTHLVTPRGYHANFPVPPTGPVHGGEDDVPPDTGYPITLNALHGARVLVVGGGQVAERKVRGLLAVGASVRLISPQATAQLQAWASQGQLDWEQRPYQPQDVRLDGVLPLLVFAATDQRVVNAQVGHAARELGILCNVADAPDESTFHLPAVHRADGLTIAVSTGGSNPARAAQIRDQLAAWREASSGDRGQGTGDRGQGTGER